MLSVKAYCRNIVRNSILESEFPVFKEFLKKYEDNLPKLAQILEQGYYETEDCQDLDFYWDIEEEEGDIVANQKAENYIKNFLKDFEKLREDVKKKTGAVLNLGYVDNDLTENVYEYYFYIENAFIKNPEIDDSFFKKIETSVAIAEEL